MGGAWGPFQKTMLYQKLDTMGRKIFSLRAYFKCFLGKAALSPSLLHCDNLTNAPNSEAYDSLLSSYWLTPHFLAFCWPASSVVSISSCTLTL